MPTYNQDPIDLCVFYRNAQRQRRRERNLARATKAMIVGAALAGFLFASWFLLLR